MQAVQVAADSFNLINSLTSGVSLGAADENPSGSQFNTVLKNIQGKAGEKKSTGPNSIGVEAKPSQSGMEQEDTSTTSVNPADLEATSHLVQNPAITMQPEMAQNSLLGSVFYGMDFSVFSTLKQSSQLTGTQNKQLNSTQAADKLPLYVAPSVFSSAEQNFLPKSAMALVTEAATGFLAEHSGQTTTPQPAFVSLTKENEDVNLLKSQGIATETSFPLADTQLKGSAATTKDFAQNTTIPITRGAAAALSAVTTPLALQVNNAISKTNKLLQQKVEISGQDLSTETTSTLTEMNSGLGTQISSAEVPIDAFAKNFKTALPSNFEQTSQQNSNVTTAEALIEFMPDEAANDKLEESGIILPGSTGYHNSLSVGNLTAVVTDAANSSSNIDPHNIITQIVDQAHLTNGVNNSEMVIKLKPDHLGDLTLKIAVSNGSVSATFHSDNSDVRTVLEASIAQFKQEMANSGIKVSHVGIYAGLDQFFSGGQHNGNAWQYVQSNQTQNQRFADEITPEIEALTASQLVSSQSTGVDYRI